MLYLILGVIVALTLYCVRIDTSQLSAALSYEKSNFMKGLLALLIVLHHLVLASNAPGIGLEAIKYIAFPLVSVFFFFSGYGLVKSYYKNGGKLILKQFAVKRMTRLLIPYIMLIFSYALYRYYLEPAAFNLKQFLGDVLLAREIGPLWYMTVIVILYTIFAICFKYLEAVNARRLIFFGTILYVFLCICFSVPSQWYSSVIGFYLGILYGMNESKMAAFFNKGYYMKLFLLFIGFTTLFCLRILVSSKVSDAEIIHGPFRLVIDIFFIFFLISLSEIIEIKHNIMNLIGKISYEIYLIHPFVIYAMRKKLWVDSRYSVIAYVCSIGLACIINMINNRISKMIIKSNSER